MIRMIYLDYSATTPVRDEVLDTFVKVTKQYIGNPNSLHKLGMDARMLMNEATRQIAQLLQVREDEIIYTSSSSESNNLAILGTVLKYPNRGKHIVTTRLEHSSILETVRFLEKYGYVIDYVNVLEDGRIDIDDFCRLLSKETILVTIGSVNSEVGVIQDIKRIAEIVKDYPTTFLHVDGTQAVGKIPVNLDGIDLFTFGAHKLHGLPGIAALVKKHNVEIEPLIHGGKSQSRYRSGTPTLALIASFAKALRLELADLSKKQIEILKLNRFLTQSLQQIDGVVINSNNHCLPSIINVSVPSIKPETMLHALEAHDVYISTKTACSGEGDLSDPLVAMGKSQEIANSSLRISLSSETTLEEIKQFLKIFEQCVRELKIK